MYKIEETDYGLKLTFSEFIHELEAKRWFDETSTAFSKWGTKPLSILIDMRNLHPLPVESLNFFILGQKLSKEQLIRSAIIFSDTLVKMQLSRSAEASGITNNERYINANEHSDWEVLALNWILYGTEPY